jgi:flagellar hook-associated protein FlgK
MSLSSWLHNLFSGSHSVPSTADLQTQVSAIASNASAITSAVNTLSPKIAALKDQIPQQVIDDLASANQALASAAIAINAMP